MDTRVAYYQAHDLFIPSFATKENKIKADGLDYDYDIEQSGELKAPTPYSKLRRRPGDQVGTDIDN